MLNLVRTSSENRNTRRRKHRVGKSRLPFNPLVRCQAISLAHELTARIDLQPGQLLVPYTGPSEPCDTFCNHPLNYRTPYLADLDIGFVHFGHEPAHLTWTYVKSTHAHFVSHSCSPNCHLIPLPTEIMNSIPQDKIHKLKCHITNNPSYQIIAEGEVICIHQPTPTEETTLWVRAMEPIQANQSITIDFAIKPPTHPLNAPILCPCKSPICRGCIDTQSPREDWEVVLKLWLLLKSKYPITSARRAIAQLFPQFYDKWLPKIVGDGAICTKCGHAVEIQGNLREVRCSTEVFMDGEREVCGGVFRRITIPPEYRKLAKLNMRVGKSLNSDENGVEGEAKNLIIAWQDAARKHQLDVKRRAIELEFSQCKTDVPNYQMITKFINGSQPLISEAIQTEVRVLPHPDNADLSIMRINVSNQFTGIDNLQPHPQARQEEQAPPLKRTRFSSEQFKALQQIPLIEWLISPDDCDMEPLRNDNPLDEIDDKFAGIESVGDAPALFEDDLFPFSTDFADF